MPRRKQARPVKKVSTITYRGPIRRTTKRRSRTAIPRLNYCHQRCVALVPVKVNANDTYHDVVIPWQNLYSGAVPAQTTYTQFDQTARLGKVYKSWDQYSVTGLKIEYMPFWTSAVIGGTGTVAINQLLMFTDPDDYDDMTTKTDNAIITGPGFRNLNPYRPFKKFFSCKKLSKQMNVAWQDNSTLNPAAPVANSLTKAATMFRFKLSGSAPANYQFGSFKVTWFVHMRG